MQIRLFLPVLVQTLLILLFWLPLIGASPITRRFSNTLHSRHTPIPPRAPPSEIQNTPPSDLQDPYLNVASHYNLKFKKFPQWIKKQSSSLWNSRKGRHEDERARRNYVSPYLTPFEAKKDGWWASLDFGRMWKHFLWEVIPEWWKGPGPAPKEDVFLLRAMELPLYMSTDELYDVFEVRVRVKEGLKVKNTTTTLPLAHDLDVDGMKLHMDSFLDL